MENGGIQSILKVSFFFSTQTNTDIYKGFCKGVRYDFICHNEIREKIFFTGYGHIHGEKTCDQYILIKHIIRKMIIFEIKETNIFIDYNRKFQRLFNDVVVPTVYEKGDAILIQGDCVNQK